MGARRGVVVVNAELPPTASAAPSAKWEKRAILKCNSQQNSTRNCCFCFCEQRGLPFDDNEALFVLLCWSIVLSLHALAGHVSTFPKMSIQSRYDILFVFGMTHEEDAVITDSSDHRNTLHIKAYRNKNDC